ncbi:unnamed protein product [Caenorhabditis angaria]|uniref:Uncharacterized protein n=1 Tax=Caenorhabditis angaria TaxID=860376 RepID=A0A9P1J7M5_9PELO|nr:unnamed protein product [Caenorhabditis angaria]
MGCLCQLGYSGEHCQHVTCSQQSTDDFEESQSALAFVIRAAPSMQVQMDEIVETAEKIVNFYEGHYPIFLQAYVLAVVSNNDIVFVHEYETGQAFIDSIRSISLPPSQTACEDPLLSGVSQVLSMNAFKKYPNSPVFVFSDGPANDNFETVGDLMQKIVNTRAQINFVITDAADGSCNVDVSSNSYESLRQISRLSKGLLAQAQLTQLGEMTFQLAQNIWQYDTILTNDLEDCRKAPTFQPFFVDQSIDYLTLQATGYGLAPVLTFPNKTQVVPPLVFTNGDLYIWKTSKPPVGAYFLNINSTGTHSSVCQYRLMGRSTYRLYASISSDLLTDNTYHTPVYQQSSHLVARMDSLYLDDPLDATLEATVWYNDPATSQRQMLYASSGQWRDNCKYEMYFGTFTCPQAFLPIYINIYTSDVYGQVVLRTTTTFCSTSPPQPDTQQCLNGGVLYNNTCICQSHFSGERCQTISCENGGSSQFGICQCAAGFSGQFCEVSKCFEYNNYGFWGFNHRSLSIMIHDSLTTRATLRTLNDAAPRVFNDILYQHPKWISNYQLLRFNDSAHSLIVDSTNGKDIVSGISDLYNQNLQHSGYTCLSLDFYATLLEVISHDNVQWGGIVYVFLYGQPKQDLVSYGQILQRIEVNKIQINIIQSSLNPCGQDITVDGLISLTQFSGGSFITATTPNSGSVLNQIPTNYMSSLIYENTLTDCSDATFYIPIDDGTQSFTTYIQGYLNSAPIYTPPGDSEASVSNLFNDYGTNARMDYVVRSCDDGWIAIDNHCYKFSTEAGFWYEALVTCHMENASLANIFNYEEQSKLNAYSANANFWIGLSDSLHFGTFQWDSFNDDIVLTLNDTQYSNWLPGQPELNTDKHCVVDVNKNQHGWKTADCTEKYYYVCEKNAYTSEYTSSNPDINHLGRGIWKVQVKAQGQCAISVRSQSTIQLATRFTSNIHDDLGSDESNENTNNNRLIVYPNSLSNSKAVEYVHFYYDNQTIINSRSLKKRDNCLYNYISEPFNCPNFFYQMLITGVDDAGYLYQRIVPAACVGGIDENSCTNGGVYYKGKCICPASFYGDTCEYAYCENGGFLSATLDKCVCPPSWDGQFCQIPLCTRNQLNVPEIANTARTFIVVIDGTINGDMKTVNDNLEQTINTVLNGVNAKDPHWFTNFVGVVFRDAAAKPTTSQVITSNNTATFAKLLSDEIKNNPYTATQQKRDIFTGIVRAITNTNVVANSKVFVITAGNAQDTLERQTVVSALALSHSAVHFFFIGDTKAPGDATDYNDPSVTTLFETAHVTGGSSYQLTKPEDLPTTWLAVLASLHNSYFVLTHKLDNCAVYQDYIELDINGTEVIVDVFSQTAADIAVFDTNIKRVDSLNIVKSKTNLVTVFSQNGEQPGIWTIDIDSSLTNAGPCTINIRIQTNLEIDLAFTQDISTDGGWHDGGAVLFPRAGDFDNAIVAQASTGAILTYAQIYDLDETRLAWASPFVVRDGCAYTFISETTFKCVHNSFVVSLDGFDVEGHPFRRTYTIHCDGEIKPQPTIASVAPTSPLPVTSSAPASTYAPCDDSTVNIDILIALDSSSGISEDTFYQTIGAVKQIGNSLTIAQDKSRIVIGTYDASPNFRGDLNTIDSFEKFTEELNELNTFGYTGVSGNNIQSIFDYINFENITAPLRPAPTRKFLIFVSSTGWDTGNFVNGHDTSFADPTDSAKQLRSARLEMYAIGIGEKANMTQLAAIAKCHQHVNSASEIPQLVTYINSLFCGATVIC